MASGISSPSRGAMLFPESQASHCPANHVVSRASDHRHLQQAHLVLHPLRKPSLLSRSESCGFYAEDVRKLRYVREEAKCDVLRSEDSNDKHKGRDYTNQDTLNLIGWHS